MATQPANPEADLDDVTASCLRDLKTAKKISLPTLVRVVDKNCAACEELAAHAAHRKSRVMQVIKDARPAMARKGLLSQEDSSSGQGLFSDFIAGTSTIIDNLAAGWVSAPAPEVRGLAEAASSAEKAGSSPPHGTARKPSIAEETQAERRREEELVQQVDSALEEFRHGPARAAKEAAQNLNDLEAQRKRFTVLRSSWQSLRENITRAATTRTALNIHSLTFTLEEALSWRRDMNSWLQQSDVLCSRIEDFLFLERQEQENRRRLKSKMKEVLLGLDETVAARIAALTWSGRATAFVAVAKESHTPRYLEDELLEGLQTTFARNLETAESVAKRLVKCASAVMRVEPDHLVVEDAVGQLSRLKTNLLETADAATSASDALLAPPATRAKARASRLRLLEDAAVSLTALLQAVSEASDTLSDCPFRFQHGSGRSFPDQPDTQDIADLRDWIKNSLCYEDADYSLDD